MVNQRLAMGLLQKWGHHVTVATNGREAVACYQSKPFDLVLMDVQMPEMDGFQATACIRELEKNSGRHIPIVAMTAHAMKGDSEHCLEAGMDGYVAKPMRQRDLHEALTHLFAPGSEAPAVDQPEPASPVEFTVDWPSVQRELGGDRRLMGEVMTAFLAEGPQLVSDMQHALAAQNGPALRRAAHTLKGTLQIFRAESLQQLAHEIELLGGDGNLPAATEALARLETALAGFYREMKAFIGADTARSIGGDGTYPHPPIGFQSKGSRGRARLHGRLTNSDSSRGSPSSSSIAMTSAKFCCNLVERFPLRMGTGEARNVADKQARVPEGLNYSRKRSHTHLQIRPFVRLSAAA